MVGGGRPFSTFRAVTTKTAISVERFRVGGEYNYNKWTFDVPNYYCVIRKTSERS
jgi:hypothetical protein